MQARQPGRMMRPASLLDWSRGGGIQFEPAAPHEIGAGQGLALQELEDAAQKFAAMERCGDEFVAIAARPSRATCELAGEQRLEPGLARAQSAHRRYAVERAGKLNRDNDKGELLTASGPQRSETLR